MPFQNSLDTGILEADGVEQAPRRLRHARRWVAAACLQRGAPRADCPKGLDIDGVEVFQAIPEYARGYEDRIAECERTASSRRKVNGEVDHERALSLENRLDSRLRSNCPGGERLTARGARGA